MNTASMEREAEVSYSFFNYSTDRDYNQVVSLKKKLESMVKLNKTLSQERATLLEKCKASVRDRWIMVIR